MMVELSLITVLAQGFFCFLLGFCLSQFNSYRNTILPPAGDADNLNDNNAVSDRYGLLDAPYKLVLCVNTNLNMGKGKIAAQCGHATLGAFQSASLHCPSSVRWWQRTGQAKIAVKVENDSQLLELEAKARAEGLISYVVLDAGRTQIAAGSRTVLAIGPAPAAVIDKITSHLKLLYLDTRLKSMIVPGVADLDYIHVLVEGCES